MDRKKGRKKERKTDRRKRKKEKAKKQGESNLYYVFKLFDFYSEFLIHRGREQHFQIYSCGVDVLLECPDWIRAESCTTTDKYSEYSYKISR